MPFTLDAEFAAAIAPMLAQASNAPRPAAGDVASRRAAVEALMRTLHDAIPMPGDVSITDYETTAADGARLLLRWYARRGAAPGPAVLYIHGGGMILGSVALYDRPVARYVSESGVPFLSVEYRYAPEHPHPVPVQDCHAGLCWLFANAAELGVDAKRIAVMGDSAGGGLAAALAIVNRDRGGPALARQILIYPMLDDRNTVTDPLLAPFATWTPDDNLTGWTALLGAAVGGPDVSPHAAPARLRDASGLPPAYIEVGELDIFRDEDIDYARLLTAAGISTELHVHPGVPHGWETTAPDIAVSRRSRADRLRVIASL